MSNQFFVVARLSLCKISLIVMLYKRHCFVLIEITTLVLGSSYERYVVIELAYKAVSMKWRNSFMLKRAMSWQCPSPHLSTYAAQLLTQRTNCLLQRWFDSGSNVID